MTSPNVSHLKRYILVVWSYEHCIRGNIQLYHDCSVIWVSQFVAKLWMVEYITYNNKGLLNIQGTIIAIRAIEFLHENRQKYHKTFLADLEQCKIYLE